MSDMYSTQLHKPGHDPTRMTFTLVHLIFSAFLLIIMFDVQYLFCGIDPLSIERE